MIAFLAMCTVMGLATAARADFTPNDLDANVWFDCKDETKFTFDAADDVAGWDDSSTESGGTTIDTVTAGADDPSGNKIARYDSGFLDFNPGHNTYNLRLGDTSDIEDAKFSTAAHMFIVLNLTTPNTTGPALAYGGWSGSSGELDPADSNYIVATNYNGGGTKVCAGGAWRSLGSKPANGYYILELQFDTTNGYRLYYDAGSLRTNSDTTAWNSSASDKFFIGVNTKSTVYTFYDYVGDIVMFDRVLSETDRQKVGQYLETKFFGQLGDTPYEYDFSAIPEPAGLGLLGVGLLALRKRRS